MNGVMKNKKIKDRKKRLIVWIFSIIVITLSINIILLYLNLDNVKTMHDLVKIYDLSNIKLFNKLSIDSVKVTSYNKVNNHVTIEIKPSKDRVSCSVNGSDFIEMKDNTCIVDTGVKNLYVYFKDKFGLVSSEYLIDSYLIETNFWDNYHLIINETFDLSDGYVLYGDIDITYKYDSTVLDIKDNIITCKSVGVTDVSVIYDGEVIDSFNVMVTNS